MASGRRRMGGQPDALGDWHRAIAVAEKHENLLLDTASSQIDNGMLELAVARLGPERIIFGTDMPLLDPFTQLAKVQGAEITDEATYLNRRQFLARAGIATAGMIGAGPVAAALTDAPEAAGARLENIRESEFSTAQPPNSWKDVTTYNNFYEFGTGKEDPAENAREFVTRPWQVEVSGECDRPGTYDYEDIVAPHPLEERRR